MAEVFTSRYLQTNVVLVGDLLVDSPYFPDELAVLPRPRRLFATHAHYDHLLGRLAFPDLPLTAAADTVAVLRADPARQARQLAEEDARTYVRRDRPLMVGNAEVADGLELIPTAPGHTGDGCAIWFEEERLLIAGDYLSDVEIPLLSWAGSRAGYLEALDRLEPFLERAELVVPGHGSPCHGRTAMARMAEDRIYLAGGPLPAGRDTVRQREIHHANGERHPL